MVEPKHGQLWIFIVQKTQPEPFEPVLLTNKMRDSAVQGRNFVIRPSIGKDDQGQQEPGQPSYPFAALHRYIRSNTSTQSCRWAGIRSLSQKIGQRSPY